MLVYNLIENNSNYSDTTENLWFHSKDEAANFNANIGNIQAFKSSCIKLNYSWKIQLLIEQIES